MDQAASAHQAVLRRFGECGEDPDLDRGVRLCAGRHRQEATPVGGVSLHIATGLFAHSIRETADPVCDFGDTRPIRRCDRQQPIGTIHFLTGQQVSPRNTLALLLVRV